MAIEIGNTNKKPHLCKREYPSTKPTSMDILAIECNFPVPVHTVTRMENG